MLDAHVLNEWEINHDRHAGSSDIVTDFEVVVPGLFTDDKNARDTATWRAEFVADGEVQHSEIRDKPYTTDEGIVYTVRVDTLRYW